MNVRTEEACIHLITLQQQHESISYKQPAVKEDNNNKIITVVVFIIIVFVKINK